MMKRIFHGLVKALDVTWLSFIAGLSGTVIFTFFLSSNYVPRFWLIIVLGLLSLLGAASLTRIRSKRDASLAQLNDTPPLEGEEMPTPKQKEELAAGWGEPYRPTVFFLSFLVMTGSLIWSLLIINANRFGEQTIKKELQDIQTRFNRLEIERDSLASLSVKLSEDTLRWSRQYRQVFDSLHEGAMKKPSTNTTKKNVP